MGSIVLSTLSVFLGMFFVFMGCIKLNQQISRDMHREIRRQFVQYAKAIPLVASLGLKVSPKYYRLSVGWLELIAGVSLAFIPGRIKLVSNIILLGVTVGGIYTHFMIGDRFERIAPSIVFTLMLCCRLIVTYQVQRRELLQAMMAAAEEVANESEDIKSKDD